MGGDGERGRKGGGESSDGSDQREALHGLMEAEEREFTNMANNSTVDLHIPVLDD